MTRHHAIALLAESELAKLSPDEREAMILDWWSIDERDREYGALPAALKRALAGDYAEDPGNALYDPLIALGLRRLYTGVLNAYLQGRLAALGHVEPVVGDVEAREACPCCGYRSLSSSGAYEICRVCFWEDDGTRDESRHSGPNHQTIAEARANFHRLGAVSEEAVRVVLPDGKQRYA